MGKKGFIPRTEEKWKFPEPLIAELNKAGLKTDGLIFCCSGDMDNDGCYKDSWLCFDGKGLYIAVGTQTVKQSKNKRKKLEAEYSVEKMRSVPIEDIDSLSTERYVGYLQK